jgi:hypothetical protein
VLETQLQIASARVTYHWDLPGHSSEARRGDQHQHEDDPEGPVAGIARELVDVLLARRNGGNGGNRRCGRGSRGWQREELRGLLHDLLELVDDHDGGVVDVRELKDLHDS